MHAGAVYAPRRGGVDDARVVGRVAAESRVAREIDVEGGEARAARVVRPRRREEQQKHAHSSRWKERASLNDGALGPGA